jgi:hypothetical protein
MVASLPILSGLLPRCYRQIKSQRSEPKNKSVSGEGSHGSFTLVSKGSNRLQTKDSQEGIIRQDEVELAYYTPGPRPRDAEFRNAGNSVTVNDRTHRPSMDRSIFLDEESP